MKKRFLIAVVGSILVASILVVGLAAPVQAVTKWKYQSMWVPSITLWRGDKYFGDLMNVLAAGELEIKFYEGGTLVKTSNEIFDAVVAGSIQMATDWPSAACSWDAGSARGSASAAAANAADGSSSARAPCPGASMALTQRFKFS